MPTSPDSLDDVSQYYEKNNEAERFQRQQLEYLVTLQILAHYLPTPVKILELGAGAGAYTLELARVGHDVTANDLCDGLLQKNRAAVRAAGFSAKVHFVPGDARTISERLGDSEFDAILVMGPFYHLVREPERHQLMGSLLPHVKSKGLIFSAHMTRTGFIKHVFQRTPRIIVQNPQHLAEVWENGFDPAHPKDGNFRGYWSNPVEAKELHEKAGLTLRAIHAQDPCVGSQDELFNLLPMEEKLRWASFLFGISGDANLWGDARHFIGVGQKP